MFCTQQKQLVRFPKVRIMKKWFRTFNNDKTFRNEGSLHLFSLMALYSYANFRSNTTRIGTRVVQEGPGQWTCKLSALPRILRVHSKKEAETLMDYFQSYGFLTYQYLDKESGLLQFSICDWKRHCTSLSYNYYSYKGSGFFFFPLPVGRILVRLNERKGKVVFSELDAIMDMWLHTILNDDTVAGSEVMPVVYYTNMRGRPLLSYSYLAHRWGWSKSKVGRFVLKLEAEGIIDRISFSSSHGTVISMVGYREMIFGHEAKDISMRRVGEVLNLVEAIEPHENAEDMNVKLEKPVPQSTVMFGTVKVLKIQLFQGSKAPVSGLHFPMIFYTGIDCSAVVVGTRSGEKSKKRRGVVNREQIPERGG